MSQPESKNIFAPFALAAALLMSACSSQDSKQENTPPVFDPISTAAADKKVRLTRVINMATDLSGVSEQIQNQRMKIDLATGLGSLLVSIQNDTITINALTFGSNQSNALRHSLSFIEQQKKDGLPYQPACFSGSYYHNSGIALVPAAC